MHLSLLSVWSSVLIFSGFCLQECKKKKSWSRCTREQSITNCVQDSQWNLRIELGATALIKTRFYHLIGWLWPSSNRIATVLCPRFSVKMGCSTETTQVSIATGSTLDTAQSLKQGYLFSVKSRESSWGSKQTWLNTIYHWNQQCLLFFLIIFIF